MPSFDVEVTVEDIDAGVEGVFNSCPIALALKKLGCEKLDVDENRILLTYKDNRYVYKTPRDANLFIDDYDSSRVVDPIEFTLENPKLATIQDERPPLFGRPNGEEEI